MRKTLLIILVVFISQIDVSNSVAQPPHSIPMYHPVYQDLHFLKTAGYFPELDLTSLPISEKTLFSYLETVSNEEISSLGFSHLFKSIRSKFLLYPDTLNYSGIKKENTPEIRFGTTFTPKFTGGNPYELTGGIRPKLQISMGKYISVMSSYFLSNDYSRGEVGAIYQVHGYSAYGELAYARSQFEALGIQYDFTLGRDFTRFGPGMTGSLLFSETSRPFDQIKLALTHRPFRFAFGSIQLNNHSSVNRYLSFHRLTFYPLSNLTISVNESALYTGENRSVDWKYSNPLLLFHGVQYNSAESPVNTLGTIEINWYPVQSWRTWAEILIDDFQVEKQEKGDLEPNEIGIIFGLQKTGFPTRSSNFWMEYSAIRNRTYQTINPDEIYTHRGYPIGHPLGNDFDEITFHYSQWINRHQLQPFIEFSYLRDGANDLETPFDEPWLSEDITLAEGYSEPFPTNPIEYTANTALGLRYLHTYQTQFVFQLNYVRKTLFSQTTFDFFFKLSFWFNPSLVIRL